MKSHLLLNHFPHMKAFPGVKEWKQILLCEKKRHIQAQEYNSTTSNSNISERSTVLWAYNNKCVILRVFYSFFQDHHAQYCF